MKNKEDKAFLEKVNQESYYKGNKEKMSKRPKTRLSLTKLT